MELHSSLVARRNLAILTIFTVAADLIGSNNTTNQRNSLSLLRNGFRLFTTAGHASKCTLKRANILGRMRQPSNGHATASNCERDLVAGATSNPSRTTVGRSMESESSGFEVQLLLKTARLRSGYIGTLRGTTHSVQHFD